MVNFPEDIIIDILVRLPVESIGRFRCVNKAWCQLLKDPKFIKKHLNHATEMDKFSVMLRSKVNNDIYTTSYDPSSSTCTQFVNTDRPFTSETSLIRSIGYCNGLVCIHLQFHDKSDNVYLWNPSTKECKELPEIYSGSDSFTKDYGFGYDYEIEDYKVVSLSCRDEDAFHSSVHVYTLKSSSWRSLGRIPYDLFTQWVLANTVLYCESFNWDAYCQSRGTEKSNVVLSFDFEKEIFQEIRFPNLSDERFEKDLCNLGGSLCLRCFNPEIGVELWELKGDRLQKSWSKLLVIDVGRHFGVVRNLTLLRSFMNGNFLIGLDKDADFHVLLYDPKHETTKSLVVSEGIKEGHFSVRAPVYVESLVSLNSGTCVSQLQLRKTKGKENSNGSNANEDYHSDESMQIRAHMLAMMMGPMVLLNDYADNFDDN